MSRHYHIAVADDDADNLYCLQQLLELLGHTVVVAATSGEELITKCRATPPEIIITDIRMVQIDGLGAAMQINDEMDVPIIVLSGFMSDELLDRSNECGVFGYLSKPVRQDDLSATIEVAFRRHQEFQILRNEASTLKQALEDRKIIERAKGVLMKKWNLNEQHAFHHLQKLARTHRQKMIDVAKGILLGEEALDTRPHSSLE